ncbi:LysR family transcriptional regulator [Allosphingosinicella deserti]|uniref:LysR family transcriptional regulator n=1 Tax=Allosphingosinicella deserti TaxID=2116704 RepID=A0A2P7QS90_9SPHN|nr:LysR family transcriptional regulator [Sphingomonas deserti]PSJ40800.1 LysR family transcriptional regulator [Sphingomonas deserti]
MLERSAVDLLDVLAFVRVVETGAFSRAAERMGMSKSIVSRRVARLEDQLGARLLTRSAAGAQPTDPGQAYFERASNVLAELEAAQEVVADAMTQVAGAIRLSAPLSFGISYLAPALAEFAAANPRVELDISLDDRNVDLIAGGFDLAVRIGRLEDSALIARKIAPVHRILVGSPDYLERRGRPAHPRDLTAHDILVYGNEQWRFRIGSRWETIRVQPRLRADNGEMLRVAAEKGLGLCLLPTFIASQALASRALEPLLIDFALQESGLHAVMPPGRASTARVRALVDFLVGRFGPEPIWNPCFEADRKHLEIQSNAGRDNPKR